MTDYEVNLFQSLVDLREQLIGDYTGDYSEMKALVDKVLTKMLTKINSSPKK